MKQSFKFLALLIATFLLLSLMVLPALADDSDSPSGGLSLGDTPGDGDIPTINYDDLFPSDNLETTGDSEPAAEKAGLPGYAVALIVAGSVLIVAGATVTIVKVRKK